MSLHFNSKKVNSYAKKKLLHYEGSSSMMLVCTDRNEDEDGTCADSPTTDLELLEPSQMNPLPNTCKK
jgi:hypothetical protein